MVQINTPASGHGRITSPAGNHYWEYSSASALRTLQRAIFILQHNVRGMRPCNDCFRRLPGGRSFDDVFADNNVWINYEARTDRDWFGITLGVGGTEISISQTSFNIGRWWVASTLVHELAHVNGAPIDTAEAEGTLLCCGFSAHHTGVIGMRQSGSDIAYA